MTSKIVLFSMLLAVAFVALLAPADAGNDDVDAVDDKQAAKENDFQEHPWFKPAVKHFQQSMGPERIKWLGDKYDLINEKAYEFLKGWL
jgi:hypothetical protein